MDLSRFPRRRYTVGATPIELLTNLSRALGGPDIYIKRDDTLGLSPGGNKTRKLEFLVADAIARNADTLITCGAPQSNHCRITLAAAAREGLKCRFVIEERVPKSYDDSANGNHFLFRLMGVDAITVVPGGSNLAEAMQADAEVVKRQGGRPYVIPGGGSNALGALGYVACAQEMVKQWFDESLRIDHIVVGSGSSGTHAGLLAGFYGMNVNIPVTGIGVSRDPQDQVPLVYRELLETCKLLGLRGEPAREMVQVDGGYWRPKYSLPNQRMVEAVQLLARHEGILLDPTYTGKAMAGLIGLIRAGRFAKGDNVLFMHTGGMPSLFASTDVLMGRTPVVDP